MNNNQQLHQLAIFDMDNTVCSSFVEVGFFQHYTDQQKRIAYQADPHNWVFQVRKCIESKKHPLKDIEAIFKQVPLVQGMQEVFEELRRRQFDIIILSGANDFLCRKFLQVHNCSHYIKDVLANPMHYDCVTDTFQNEIVADTDCGIPMCGRRICKRTYLQQYLNRNKHYKKIYFFGDGTNDLCGMSVLKEQDCALIRKYFSLYNCIKAEPSLKKNHLKCSLKYWNDGRDILKLLD